MCGREAWLVIISCLKLHQFSLDTSSAIPAREARYASRTSMFCCAYSTIDDLEQTPWLIMHILPRCALSACSWIFPSCQEEQSKIIRM